MIILRTGLPGASKTLTTIYELCQSDSVGEVPFYYNNIKYFCLDIESVSSFGSWLIHVYLPLNKENKSIKPLIAKIHETGRLVSSDDFPHLINDYQIWLDSNGHKKLFIHWVLIAYPKNKTSLFSDYLRDFPQCSLQDLKRFKLHWSLLPDPQLWYQCEHPSIIVLDECQRYFSPRPNGSKVPRHVSEFETHRHLGTDIYLITQDAKLLDSNIRRLTGKHIHLVNLMGSSRVRRMESPENFDPSDYHAAKNSIKSIIKHPKHLYGIYLSSLNHTHKLSIPKKFFAPFFFLFMGILLVFSLFNKFQPAEPVKTNTQVISDTTESTNILPIEVLVNPVPGCSSLSLAGINYHKNEYVPLFNCIQDEIINVTIENFEAEPFTYSYNKNSILTPYHLQLYGYSVQLVGNALFLVKNSNFYLLDFIYQ